MKYKYLIFAFFLFLFIEPVFAITDIGYVTNDTTLIISNGRGADINLSNGVVNSNVMDIRNIIITTNYNFLANKVYELELSTPTQNLININNISIRGYNNVCSFFGLSDMNVNFPKIFFKCPSNTSYVVISLSNLSDNNITGNYNFRWNYAYLRSMDEEEMDLGPVISNQNQNTQDIIDNQSQNTQDIIDNQSQNTQDIIDNQSQNTDRIIEDNKKNFQTCRDSVNLFNKNATSYYSNGATSTVLNTGVSVKLTTSGTYRYVAYRIGGSELLGKTLTMKAVITPSASNTAQARVRFGRSSSPAGTAISSSLTSSGSLTFTVPSSFPSNTDGIYVLLYANSDGTGNANDYIDYTNFQIEIGSTPTSYEDYGEQVCTSKLDEQKNAINNLNDSITNDNVDDNGIGDAFDDFNEFLDDNSTITQLITLPVTLYTAILNNLNGSCSPFNLGSLFGTDLILPCINISQYLGNSLWTMIDIIISGFAIYEIAKKFIKVFNNLSSLREGDVIDD